MIRTVLDKIYTDGIRLIDGYCNSGDSKPTTGIATGSRLVEVDTAVEYRFDEDGARWVPQFALLDNTRVGMALVDFAKVG